MEGREVVDGNEMKDIMEARVVEQATQDPKKGEEIQTKAFKGMEAKAVAQATGRTTAPIAKDSSESSSSDEGDDSSSQRRKRSPSSRREAPASRSPPPGDFHRAYSP